MNKEKVYVLPRRIDIAKANLDIALYSSEKKWVAYKRADMLPNFFPCCLTFTVTFYMI